MLSLQQLLNTSTAPPGSSAVHSKHKLNMSKIHYKLQYMPAQVRNDFTLRVPTRSENLSNFARPDSR